MHQGLGRVATADMAGRSAERLEVVVVDDGVAHAAQGVAWGNEVVLVATVASVAEEAESLEKAAVEARAAATLGALLWHGVVVVEVAAVDGAAHRDEPVTFFGWDQYGEASPQYRTLIMTKRCGQTIVLSCFSMKRGADTWSCI
jgi:hypothetical protein